MVHPQSIFERTKLRDQVLKALVAWLETIYLRAFQSSESWRSCRLCHVPEVFAPALADSRNALPACSYDDPSQK